MASPSSASGEEVKIASAKKFLCECGGAYVSADSLRSHKRRYCKLARLSQPGDNNDCPICAQQFTTYQGVRLHMKRRHTEEYNESLQKEASSVKRRGWTEDEENYLVKAEAMYEGGDVATFLASISNRTKEAIRMRRKRKAYIEKVAAYKRQQEAAKELKDLRTSEVQTRLEDDRNDNTMLDEQLKHLIAGIPVNNLLPEDVRFRDYVTSNSKEEAVIQFELWISSLHTSGKKPKRAPKASHHVNSKASILTGKKINKRRKRALDFRVAQEEFRRNRSRYARTLLDDTRSTEIITPAAEDVKQLYTEIFSSNSPIDGESITDRFPKTFIGYPITSKEVEECLKTTKTNTPGPDGITLNDVRRLPIDRLLLLYNTILYLEYIPRPYKESRTVLIPKARTELHLCKNWRPITITSTILRVLNKILAKRLMTINLCANQRGFTKIDGCFANFATLHTIIKHHRQAAKPLSVISLDVAKAFDMVSHDSIRRAMQRLNIDAKTRNIIGENYREAHTTMTCSNQEIGSFAVNRGVKQGDPLSPFIFNAVMDELIVQLDKEFSGISMGDTKATCLAYADDLILYATTPDDANRMLQHCVEFLQKRGLHLNAGKCRSIVLEMVPGKKKLYVRTEPSFSIQEENIPSIGIGEECRYLGHYFNSEGVTACNNKTLIEQLARIHSAPLKPHQKLTIIRDHLIPRYIAVLQRPNVARKILQKIDKNIRSALKRVLHIHIHAHNSIFYAPIKAGGLGIFQFSTMIPIITTNRWERLKNWSELLADTYEKARPWISRFEKMVKEGLKEKTDVHKHHEQLLQNSFSGNGLRQVKNHPASSAYLKYPPRYWSGEDFVRAIHLRYNLLPCKSIPSNPQQERTCRAGCYKNESLSHILQQCPLVHRWRILRHDYVVKRLATAAKKTGWTAKLEPHIRGKDNLLKKPDIIFEKDSDVIVTDVGINWEGPIPLSTQAGNKTAIYSTPAFVERLQYIYKDKNIYILPLIMGARGAWCSKNDSLIEHLKIPLAAIQDIVTTTLRGSWTIHRHFMSSVWRERFQHTQRRRINRCSLPTTE